MTREQAKEILELYRPTGRDAEDPQVAEALILAREDAELSSWLRQHAGYQAAVEKKFRNIPVPSYLKDRILSRDKIVRPEFRPTSLVWLRVAAMVAILLALGGVLFSLSKQTRVPDGFADYRVRMVRSALREYRMEVVTSDLGKVRQLMTSRGAPADFSVPKKLAKLQLTGGGALQWRSHPVSMICYNRGDNKMLFLFVMERAAIKDPPPSAPEMLSVGKLQTASWTEGDKTYFLAGPQDENLLGKYL